MIERFDHPIRHIRVFALEHDLNKEGRSTVSFDMLKDDLIWEIKFKEAYCVTADRMRLNLSYHHLGCEGL